MPRRPGPPLARFVDALFYARGRIEYRREHILPTGGTTLLIVLGDAIAQTPGAGGEHRSRTGFVAGLQNAALGNRPLGETHVCGVSFRTGGAYPFLGVPQSELTDRVVDLDDLWGRAARDLRQQIGDAATPAARLDALERGLVGRLSAGTEAERIHLVLDYLRRTAPPSVRELADHVGLSHKHLIAVCKKIAGATPKRLARIHRFRRVLDGAGTPAATDWAALSLDCGYCDQAHLAREFRDLAGMTPTQYLRRRAAVFGDRGGPPAFVPEPTADDRG